MSEEYTHVAIDWAVLESRAEYRNRNSLRHGPTVSWDCPHAIYRSTSKISTGSLPSPYKVIPKRESTFVDENIQYDTDYYYLVSELRPGGEYITDKQTQIRVETVTLNTSYGTNLRLTFSRIEDKPDACSGSIFYNNDGSGGYYCIADNSAPPFPMVYVKDGPDYPVSTLSYSQVAGNGGKIWDEWKYNGTGTPSEWIVVYLDGSFFTAFARSRKRSVLVDTQKVDYDLRNYSPPKKVSNDQYYLSSDVFGDGRNLTSGFPFRGVSQPRPEWWDEYIAQVQEGNVSSWHDFWKNRPGNSNPLNPRSNSSWYNDTW